MLLLVVLSLFFNICKWPEKLKKKNKKNYKRKLKIKANSHLEPVHLSNTTAETPVNYMFGKEKTKSLFPPSQDVTLPSRQLYVQS